MLTSIGRVLVTTLPLPLPLLLTVAPLAFAMSSLPRRLIRASERRREANEKDDEDDVEDADDEDNAANARS